MPDTQVSEFEQLMNEVAAGSEDAVWKLADTYTPYILRVVRPSLTPQVRRRVDSQDLAQILWASLLLRRGELTKLKTPQQFIAYLCKAAKNRAIDARRRYLTTERHNLDRERSLDLYENDELRPSKKPHKDRALHARDLTPSQTASVRERWKHFLMQTSEDDRRILRLRLEGHEVNAIARQMNLHRTTVMRVLDQLLARLSK